jgi:hypothetical protein
MAAAASVSVLSSSEGYIGSGSTIIAAFSGTAETSRFGDSYKVGQLVNFHVDSLWLIL